MSFNRLLNALEMLSRRQTPRNSIENPRNSVLKKSFARVKRARWKMSLMMESREIMLVYVLVTWKVEIKSLRSRNFGVN